MTEYTNLFDIQQNIHFTPSESVFANSNSIQDNNSDICVDSQSKPVRLFSDASNEGEEGALELSSKRVKTSVSRDKEVCKPALSNGIKRKKVNGVEGVKIQN